MGIVVLVQGCQDALRLRSIPSQALGLVNIHDGLLLDQVGNLSTYFDRRLVDLHEK